MSETIAFALSELNRYYNILTADDGLTAEAKVIPEEFSGGFENYDSFFDDAYIVRAGGGRIDITASNERSVLLAVYGFLRKLGCIFTRPGAGGEVLPAVKKENFRGELRFKAKYRHRGVAIEGAVSYENVAAMIDYLPKNGYNSYFLQFDNSYEFFERWYLHKNNEKLAPEAFDINEIYHKVVSEIKKRNLILHSVGHGWTAKAVGCDVTGWDKHECEKDNELLALVNGKRKYFKDVPSNTNLCYSNPAAQEAFANCVADYAEKHPETEVLHVWLADDCKNFCECENCKRLLPSDSYVLALNKIDEILSARKIKTRIAFLAYCELLWAPVKYKIKNEDRFILMFAPITRPFSQNISDEAENSLYAKNEAFVLNKSAFPGDLTRNLAFLREWKNVFKGDSFIFDYPLMWEINKDISTLRLPGIIKKDVAGLKKIGLNGEISCQLQRAFFPHGYSQTVLGLELCGEKTDDDFKKRFFRGLYGDLSEKCLAFFEQTAKNLPVDYFRYDIPEVCFSVSQGAEAESLLAAEFAGEIAERLKKAKKGKIKSNLEILAVWLKYVRMLSAAIAQKARGEDCEEKSKEILDYLKAHEIVVQPYYDVFYASVTVASILSTHWDKCLDEKCDEAYEQIKNGSGRQISESFVSGRDEVKLRYGNIVSGSYEFYLKNADGSYLKRFVEGKDYEINCENGTVKRTENSAFPDFTKSPFYGLEKFNHNDFVKWGNKDYIIYVDYKYDVAANVSDALVAENAAKKSGGYGALKDFLTGLPTDELKITVFGDSISTGMEANGEGNAYFYRFRKKIIDKYGKKVKIINKSVVGDSTAEGMSRFETAFADDDSDMVIVAFGMNDQNIFGDFMPVTPEIFRENLKFMGEKLTEKGKKVVFVTPCVPNGKWVYCSGKIGEYADIVRQTAKELGCPYADANLLWNENLAAGKRSEDLLSNGINHPADYGHYLYYLALKQLI